LLLVLGWLLPADPATGQPGFLPGGDQAPEEGDGETQAEDAAASDDEDDEEVGYSEPEHVIDARLLGWPVVARARLMATREAIKARRDQGAHGVYLANIHGEIELGISYYVERAVSEAEQADAVLLVFDIETPGGRVDAAVNIRDAILDSEVPTIAFVNRRAWSAGALIAMANDLVVVAEGSSIGAATPVQMGAGEMQPVEEKVVSALRSEFRSTAEATRRSTAIAESMVDRTIEVGGVIPRDKLLTLTGQEALDVGLAEYRAPRLERLLASLDLGDQPVETIQQSWAESIVRILTSPMVSGILMTLGMLGLFFELTTPGFGWAGAMGLTCLVIFFTGHLLVELTGFEEIALLVVGLALLALEIFVTPGFGVLGVLGLLAIGASLVLSLVAYSPFQKEFVLSHVSIREALLRVLASLVMTVVGTVLLVRYVPRTRVGRRLILSEALASGTSLPEQPFDIVRPGDGGIALTDLRPYGKARIGGRRVEVVAEGNFIHRQSPLEVVRVAGNRVEVRAASKPASEPEEE
jgi:membrane-bound serine protease (ClpP class)